MQFIVSVVPQSSRSTKFESMPVWKGLQSRNLLSWYYATSTNRMPSKYLICRHLRCNLDLAHASEEELWKEHRVLTHAFLDLWKNIRSGQIKLQDLTKADTSLMDLNVELCRRMFQHCNFCRWNCQIDRSKDGGTKHGTCQLESTSRVSSYFHHSGEELVFRGTEGSGTIFFTSCNMRCSFCQNGDISTDKDNGIPITPTTLALMAWQLRMEGCHNTNWVGGDPTIHLHTIVSAINLLDTFTKPEKNQLAYAESVKADSYYHFETNAEHAFYQSRLFNCPQLWNSNFFMSPETMDILHCIIDVWLPDFKFGPGRCAMDLSRTPWYWETVTDNLRLVYCWGEDMVIRHLIMPNHVECCTKPVLDWIAKNMPQVPVNIMDQYHPDNLCDPRSPKYRDRYDSISRACTQEETAESYKYAKELGLNFEPVTFD